MQDYERFARIIDEMYNLYIKKNANYGNSFEKLFQDLGPIAGIVPLHNKLDRITNLVKGGHNDFEPLQDSFIDLATYAIMNVIELQKNNEQRASHSSESSSTSEKVILNENNL